MLKGVIFVSYYLFVDQHGISILLYIFLSDEFDAFFSQGESLTYDMHICNRRKYFVLFLL
jgi:hypothetical protein